MKKGKLLPILGIGVAYVLLLALILNTFRWNADEIREYRHRFVFAAPLQWSLVAEGIRDADREFQVDTKLCGSSNLNEKKQIEAINDAISTHADGIITAALSDSEELKDAIGRAVDAGIPVILVDSDLPDSARTCYIGTDNAQAGYIAGKKMIEETGGFAKIGVVVSEMASGNQKDRVEGFKEAIAGEAGMEILEILECHSDMMELSTRVPEMLEEHPELDALYLTEGYAGIIVGTILKTDSDSEKPVVVAFDLMAPTLEFLKEEIYDTLIFQRMYDEGYKAVETLCRIKNGETVQPVLYTEAGYIDRENCADYEIRDVKGLIWHE